MADTYTTNLNLTKPEPGAAEDTWGISLNSDLDTLDAIFSSSGTQVNLNPNQVNFADNKKAIFGTGSDLEIYHDGSDSYVRESGTGELRVQGTNLRLMSTSHENYLTALENAGVRLWYDNNIKLTTTSTGIDVTGTVTSDGLTVDGDSNLGSTTRGVQFTTSGTGSYKMVGGNSAASEAAFTIDAKAIDTADLYLATDSVNHVKIAQNGDISFYDDTGTTAKLLWDASAERLYGDTTTTSLRLSNSAGSQLIYGTGTLSVAPSLVYSNSGSERFRVTGSGFVGIGTSVPQDKLSIEGGNVSINNGSAFQVGGSVSGNTVIGKLKSESGVLTLKADSTRDVQFGSETNGTAMFIEGSNGNVGIGTVSPTEKLTIKKTVTTGDGATALLGVFAEGGAAGEDAEIYLGHSSSRAAKIVAHKKSSGNNHDLSFSTNADASAPTEKMRITSAGNVGIGTDSPTSYADTTLHVSGSTGSTLKLSSDNSGNTDTDGFDITHSGATAFINNRENGDMVFRTNNTEALRIDSSQRVGIGTSSPARTLEVVAASPTSGIIADFKNSTNAGGTVAAITLTNANNLCDVTLGAERTQANAGSDFFISLSDSSYDATNVERFRITETGNVGIGTDAPSGAAGTALAINGGASQARLALKNTNSGDGTGDGLQIVLTDGDAGIEQRENLPLYFKTNNVEAMRITNSQNVGIATSSPAERLTVSGNQNITGKLAIGSASAHPSFDFYNQNTAYFNGAVTIDDNLSVTNGSVGIGTSSPSASLTVAGGIPNAPTGDGVHLGLTSNYAQMQLNGSAGGIIDFSTSGVDSIGRILYDQASDYMRFDTNYSERMRLDSAGNLMVSTTNGAPSLTNVAGIVLRSEGHIYASRDGGVVSYLNRMTTDGTILDFRKDGSNVGQINVAGGDISIGTGTVGFQFWDGGNAIYAWNPSTNSVRDAAIDIGYSGGRFKDLHLSGTANVGGLKLGDNEFILAGTGSDLKIGHDGTNNIIRSQGPSLYINANNHIFTGYSPYTEHMRIDSSGELLAGKTSADNTTAGHRFNPSGFVSHVRSGNEVMILNRLSSDGSILTFRKDGATIGQIGTVDSDLTIYTTGSGHKGLRFGNGYVAPTDNTGTTTDNTTDLGLSSQRFKDIYATNGTIQTSDINEKQDIEDLSEAETRVAVAAKGLLKKYRWKSAVADKGDDARIHFGIMAQDLENAFANEGLDAGDYGMFISSTWTDEATGEEKTRLGVRYNELLAFIIAAI